MCVNKNLQILAPSPFFFVFALPVRVDLRSAKCIFLAFVFVISVLILFTLKAVSP